MSIPKIAQLVKQELKRSAVSAPSFQPERRTASRVDIQGPPEFAMNLPS